MAWIPLTEHDILTKLSAPEMAAIKTAATANGGQPTLLSDVIAQVVREIRGYLAGCPDNTLGPADTIPDELLGAATNRARYELPTRLPVASLLTEARVEANRDAIALLRDCAACRFRVVQPPPDEAGEQPIPAGTAYWGSEKQINFGPC